MRLKKFLVPIVCLLAIAAVSASITSVFSVNAAYYSRIYYGGDLIFNTALVHGIDFQTYLIEGDNMHGGAVSTSDENIFSVAYEGGNGTSDRVIFKIVLLTDYYFSGASIDEPSYGSNGS